ncbi:putative nuclease HARBI1 [Lineus longissimus]|uniref:putative nuclease HARBI1 n=1 Tax=Lineus longissimus TaxID=88925 RepID=UPI00315D1D6D
MVDNQALFVAFQPFFQAPRHFRERINHLEFFNDKKLFKRYRFCRETIVLIVDMLREDIESATNRSHAISPEVQVLIALRYFASGAFFEVIGDTFGVDKASVSRVVHRVAGLLDAARDDFIVWPQSVEERRRIQAGFYAIAHFPKVLGCIDGTHIRIICPSEPRPDADHIPEPANAAENDQEMRDDQIGLHAPDPAHAPALPMPADREGEAMEEAEQPAQVPPAPAYEASFVNRKGYHSINVQAVVDDKGKFTNVVARWPGATHDAFIWRNSDLKEHLELTNPRGEDGLLLGDSGYPCMPYLIVPYGAPTTEAQQRLNTSLCATRVRIEHAFGVLKRRFHVLHGEIRMQPDRVVKIISACFVLHNIAKMRGERDPRPEDDDSDDEEDDEDDDEEYAGPNSGSVYRDYLANRYFA